MSFLDSHSEVHDRINLNSNGLSIRVKRFIAVSYCFITFP